MKSNMMSKAESDLCWLLGLKACTSRKGITDLWEENKQQPKSIEELRKEFLKQLVKGLLEVSHLMGCDRIKYTQIIKNIADITIFTAIGMINTDTVLQESFITLVTLITYKEQISHFCSLENFEIIIGNLQQLEKVCFVCTRDGDLFKVNYKQNMKESEILRIKQSSLYSFVLQNKSVVDPFSNKEEEVEELVEISDGQDSSSYKTDN